MGIIVNKEIINGGNIPLISSGTVNPTLLSRTPVDNELYFWTNDGSWWGYSRNDGGWINISGVPGGVPTFDQVLAANNITGNRAVFEDGISLNTTIKETGLTAKIGSVKCEVAADKITMEVPGATKSVLASGYLSFLPSPSTHGYTIGSLYSTTVNYIQYLLEASGFLLVGQTGRKQLVSGTTVVTIPFGCTITANSTFQFSVNTPVGTLGHAYQGIFLSATTFQIVSLKANGTTETSDLSIIDWTVISK